jgi:prophage regulatory protein
MRVLPFSELKAKGVRWSRKHVTDLVNKGLFPAPVDLGLNTRGWVETEIDNWLASRVAARDNPSPEAMATRQARRQSLSDRVREDWRRRKAEAAEAQRKRGAKRKRSTDEAATGPP